VAHCHSRALKNGAPIPASGSANAQTTGPSNDSSWMGGQRAPRGGGSTRGDRGGRGRGSGDRGGRGRGSRGGSAAATTAGGSPDRSNTSRGGRGGSRGGRPARGGNHNNTNTHTNNNANNNGTSFQPSTTTAPPPSSSNGAPFLFGTGAPIPIHHFAPSGPYGNVTVPPSAPSPYYPPHVPPPHAYGHHGYGHHAPPPPAPIYPSFPGGGPSPYATHQAPYGLPPPGLGAAPTG
jgi:hypothetical protein